MHRRLGIFRGAVALCLAVLLLCQTALARPCNCSDCPGQCTPSCLCCGATSDRDEATPCANCPATCCSSGCENASFPSRPCTCQCHQAPLSVPPQPSDASTGIADLMQTAIAHWAPTAPLPLTLGQLRFNTATDSWSPMDTCVLLCRFLA